MSAPVSVIIVTRNHGRKIGPVLAALESQSERPDRAVVVDCGSDDLAWMAAWRDRAWLELVPLGRNAGFSGGNNEGWRRLGLERGLILFLNPDVILPPDLIGRLARFAAEARSRELAAWSVRLLRWDFCRGVPTTEIDSTGIFPCWNGWRDRRAGSPPASDQIETVPALCGAFFMSRAENLHSVALHGGRIWDERYVAYKEDVELSLRLRRAGGRLAVWHGAEAWHGRGWSSHRRSMPREARLLSARNEVRLHLDYARWRVPMSLLKLAAVRWFDR